ncbi:MAG: MBL fold metallo-hydrolase [Paludisphaera borealis]|uniref:ComEC/Rec2 family competence protein n=1 Tax=Paludisphaera borealis TaxID=1387353 RepID=UPI00284D6DA6|nr:MBL fold metallo-hydrolase [Paludisphaera borealis]MDR3621939.1 MBL fold metallo-hydrolase [Paludisphaera borealis]
MMNRLNMMWTYVLFRAARPALLAVAVAFGCAPAGAVEPAEKGGLDIYYIDVMGGAATLLVTPERESILIDTGWPGEDDRDPKRILHVLKEVAGLDHLDHLVTTHWHMDHFGGVEGLARRVEIKNFWDRGLPEDKIEGLDFPDGPKADDPLGVAYRAASKGKRKTVKAGDALPLRGDVKAIVLAASGRVAPAPENAPSNPLCAEAPADQEVDPSDNARSVVVRFRLGKFDFLDCGDLTWNVEKALVCPHDLIGSIDLYQVTHHGLSISNNPILLKTIQPIVAVMNNGPRKGGSAGTVERLKTIPSIQAAYQLHRNAETRAADNTDPSLIVNTDEQGGKFLHVAVSPDGSRFRVQFGVDGPERTFESH